jgi:hypothetical protein
MAFSNHLGQTGTPPGRLDVTAVCSLDRVEGGLRITEMDLEVEGDVPASTRRTSSGSPEKLKRSARSQTRSAAT